MNKRGNTLIVEVSEDSDVSCLIEWKRLCIFAFGIGGIKQRTIEIIKEDLKKLKKEKLKNEI